MKVSDWTKTTKHMKKVFKLIIQGLISVNALLAVLSVVFFVGRSIIYARDISYKYSYYLALTMVVSALWYFSNGTPKRHNTNGA